MHNTIMHMARGRPGAPRASFVATTLRLLDFGERSTHSHMLRSSVAAERTVTGAAAVPDSPRKTCRCQTPKTQKPVDQDQVKGEIAVGLFCIGI